jgi:excisionase family DNA binding protein
MSRRRVRGETASHEGQGQAPLPDLIPRRLLTIHEVAIYTGLAVSTLYTMVSQRRIPFVKMGRLTKFDSRTLDVWIEKNSVRPLTRSTLYQRPS